MTPEEVKKVSRDGVDIELHTHRRRTPKDSQLFEKEILENRDGIEKLTGKRPRHFCYPSGVYASENLAWLAGLGVSSATACEFGLDDAKTNPLVLPRFLDSASVSSIDFESWLTGVNPMVFRFRYGRQGGY